MVEHQFVALDMRVRFPLLAPDGLLAPHRMKKVFYVYVLFSIKDKKFYIGFSANLKNRLDQHKNGLVKSTTKRLPMRLIYYEAFSEEQDARRNEKYYKTGKGRKDLYKKLKVSLINVGSPASLPGKRTVGGSNPS